MRAFEGLVRTYRSAFGEEKPDSITQMLAVYTSSGAANLRENRSTHQSLVKPVQDGDGIHLSESCATRLSNHRGWRVQ